MNSRVERVELGRGKSQTLFCARRGIYMTSESSLIILSYYETFSLPSPKTPKNGRVFGFFFFFSSIILDWIFLRSPSKNIMYNIWKKTGGCNPVCDHWLMLWTSGGLPSTLLSWIGNIFISLVETLHVTYRWKGMWPLTHIICLQCSHLYTKCKQSLKISNPITKEKKSKVNHLCRSVKKFKYYADLKHYDLNFSNL